jgi:hypothetical protein
VKANLSLAEALSLVSSSSVSNEGGVLSLDGHEVLQPKTKHATLAIF